MSEQLGLLASEPMLRKAWVTIAGGDTPPIIYKMTEIVLKKNKKRYRVDVLTEDGPYSLSQKFHTPETAKRFCERHYRDLQKRRAEAA